MVSIRKRIGWWRTARRHRELVPPNMSELPFGRWSFDEQTGEVFDRRTHSKRAAVRRFRANGFTFGDVVVEKRYARWLETQEVWAARDRTDTWRARLEDELFEMHEPAERIEELLKARPVPELAPADWAPDDEWDPAWEFCDAKHPMASPVWFCEIAE